MPRFPDGAGAEIPASADVLARITGVSGAGGASMRLRRSKQHFRIYVLGQSSDDHEELWCRLLSVEAEPALEKAGST
ncbi:hypothetical protein NDU88_008050 [Pleurodeles waltl]|uniref:Uncharacterized protein n=1 Tax=Pleurodeles waltl TaxID=8319 RepID=A0AAV7VTZ9_PLEWA|nr:hypothetical protein NDU88_008050 [Pleurodeles waltl]